MNSTTRNPAKRTQRISAVLHLTPCTISAIITISNYGVAVLSGQFVSFSMAIGKRGVCSMA
jgi:hypothetical protein